MTRDRGRLGMLLAGVAAVLPVAALHAGDPSPAVRQFAPPQSSLVLTRELRRALSDGKEVVTRRSYEITISPEGDGYRVDGRLIGTEVDVPPALQALAAIERARPDTGLFPFRLDRQGQIVTQSAARDPQAAGAAGQTVGVWLSRSGLSMEERGLAEGFLRQLKSGQAASGAAWPADLFHPHPGERSESREFDLPGGDRGSVVVATRAMARSSDGLLDTVERTVTTRMGADERTTREIWRLGAERGQR